METRIVYRCFDTPIGQMLAAASPKGLCRLCLDGQTGDSYYDWINKKYDQAVVREGNTDLIQAVENQIGEYFNGSRQTFSIELDLRGTVFQRRVWHILMQIPYGSTMSYKEVAIALDNPAAVRAVGQANNKNPIPIIVPCHRVVGHNGRLVGFGGGLNIKSSLLTLEGLKVERESII